MDRLPYEIFVHLLGFVQAECVVKCRRLSKYFGFLIETDAKYFKKKGNVDFSFRFCGSEISFCYNEFGFCDSPVRAFFKFGRPTKSVCKAAAETCVPNLFVSDRKDCSGYRTLFTDDPLLNEGEAVTTFFVSLVKHVRTRSLFVHGVDPSQFNKFFGAYGLVWPILDLCADLQCLKIRLWKGPTIPASFFEEEAVRRIRCLLIIGSGKVEFSNAAACQLTNLRDLRMLGIVNGLDAYSVRTLFEQWIFGEREITMFWIRIAKGASDTMATVLADIHNCCKRCGDGHFIMAKSGTRFLRVFESGHEWILLVGGCKG